MNHPQQPPLPQAGEGWGEGGWLKNRNTAALKAKRLRQNQTDAEKKFWHEIKAKRFEGCKFRRQHPIGQYITDFCCKVIRFWNNEILENMEGVLSSLSLTLSRRRERGLLNGAKK